MNQRLDLFLTFLKLGAFTFGGGYAMLGQLKEIAVDRKGWLTDDELLEICSIAEATPGPIAVNLSTYIGYRHGGFLGALLSTIGVILPSFLIILIISAFLAPFMSNTYVGYAFKGIKCGVALLILKAGFQMLKKLDKKPWKIIIFLAVFICMIFIDLFSIRFSSIYFILIGGILSITILKILELRRNKQ